MIEGIYEQLITQLVSGKIKELDKESYYINSKRLDKSEAANILSQHVSKSIQAALNLIKGEHQIENQIEIANKIILYLNEELQNEYFEADLVERKGEILDAVFTKVDAHFSDFNLHLKEITPYTRLTQSELFTGGNSQISLESELKKEIRSANRIDLLVSFIKFKGIIIIERALEEFTQRGGQLRVITTTYMGASDYKAIKLLSKLENTQVKISYNTGNERLHAKAYLFYRNTGYHTGYIGSSNFSRSALTDGLEWNVKITTSEVSHIIDKFQKTFESYWLSGDFELFDDAIHKEKLISSLDKGKNSKLTDSITTNYFDIKPYNFQLEILEKLEVERSVHYRNRNLVVAATGTGKTVISAFDYKRFKQNNKSHKLLFLAHRKEILVQALHSYRGIIKDNNFGELWVDGIVPTRYDHVFASVQTLNNRISELDLTPEFFDYIVIDECHHLTASSYRGIIQYFQPKVLLGLTATPERMDGGDIKEDFHQRIAAEIRLPEALDRKLLCPFQYFGISDSVDLIAVSWDKGRYVVSELSKIYTSNDRRVAEIIAALDKYTRDFTDVRALGFCTTIDHARYMAEKFSLAGFKANYLTSVNSSDREIIRKQLLNKEINYLFVVDIFNEGVDIPEIDTVLFLRPTESLTVFLQQLGRGLRLAEGKDALTVLDFVGNARPEYNFENKFRALIGKTTTPVKKEIEDNFPHLPLGCSIILEKKAKEYILDNIRAATTLNQNQLIQKVKAFENQTTLAFCLKNFIKFYNIPLQFIYKRNTWSRLCQMAGKINAINIDNEKEILSAIRNKWLSTNSSSYFRFIHKICEANFEIHLNELSKEEKLMAVMLHYDVWQSAGGFDSLEHSIRQIGKNPILVSEIREIMEILIDQVDFKEIDIKLPYPQPLKLHARYTRDQILAAFGLSTFHKKSSNREGVAELLKLNSELLFINLIKSEEDFSPTTMYDDYAVNEKLFHWQSQNSAGPNTPKGHSYIHHKKTEKKILLFVREKSKDEYGNTMGYVFIGEGELVRHYGSKPMSIEWGLKEPIPHYLWKPAAKMLIG
jgi:superfamily II DNA or RNA helicase/HKD family nuclease